MLLNCPIIFPTSVFFDGIMQKTTQGGINMENENRMVRTESKANRKGYMQLAPGGEKLLAAVSAAGWIAFLVKFAII